MKNALKILMCLVLSISMLLPLVACGGAKTATVTFDYSEWEDAECDEDEREVEIGGKIGTLPKPTLEGYKFKGWFTEEEYDLVTNGEKAEKVKTTLVVEEDVVLYAYFEKTTTTTPGTGDDKNDGEQTIKYDCGAGIHKWKYAYTDPTCTAAGTQTQQCDLCGAREIDPLYSTLPANKALGHQWVADGEDGDGWKIVAMGQKRSCLREGCTKSETMSYKDLTGTAEVSATGDFYGGATHTVLLDGDWGDGDGGADALSGRGTSPWSLLFLFENATDVDQIAVSVAGQGDGSGIDAYEVYVWYADETDFGEVAVRSGYFKPGEWGKDNAHLINLSNLEKGIIGIRIDVLKGAFGMDFFYEVAVSQVPAEE